MKLSTKARHAITAMMELSLNDEIRPTTLAEISQTQGISLSYLEQLFAKLRKSGLVVGVRGPGGGYKLVRTPEEVSIAQIISAIDEYHPSNVAKSEQEYNEDLSDYQSSKVKKCVTQMMWDDLSKNIYTYLSSITLADFTNPQREADNNEKDISSGETRVSSLSAA